MCPALPLLPSRKADSLLLLVARSRRATSQLLLLLHSRKAASLLLLLPKSRRAPSLLVLLHSFKAPSLLLQKGRVSCNKAEMLPKLGLMTRMLPNPCLKLSQTRLTAQLF